MVEDLALAGPALIFVGFGLKLSIIDWQTHRLPNRVVAWLTISLLITEALIDQNRFIQSVMVGFLCFATYLFLYFLSRGQLGLGDVKFSFACGLIAGWYFADLWLLSIFIAFSLAGLVAVIGLLLKQMDKSTRLAFGPFMYLSAVGLLVYGTKPLLLT